MTQIEFFDKEAVENICTCIAARPDSVIFVGTDKYEMEQSIARYRKIFADREIPIRFGTVAVARDDLNDRVRKITEIVEAALAENEALVFDLTGGDDLCLVAVGIVFERYKGRGIQMHRINLRKNKVTDCDADGAVLSEKDAPMLSITENVRVYGGEVVFDSADRPGTPVWDMTPDFERDIGAMWAIFRSIYSNIGIGSWNRQIGIFGAIEEYGEINGLTSRIAPDALRRELAKEGEEYAYISAVIQKLEAYGLAKVQTADGMIAVTYKDPQVKRCLTKAGQALEMIVYLFVRQAADKRGAPVYNDVMNGVFIDWDGAPGALAGGVDTENEIDVMMMHGAVPVFVSCKNGKIEMEELYKLETVASRFGGRYARKVLVATNLGSSRFAAFFRQRAADMNIDLLEPMGLTDEAFRKELGHAWSFITRR